MTELPNFKKAGNPAGNWAVIQSSCCYRDDIPYQTVIKHRRGWEQKQEYQVP